jgi:polysaccharide export outer membrane protein
MAAQRIMPWGASRRLAWPLLCCALAVSLGCQSIYTRPRPRLAGPQTPPHFGDPVPTEKDKSSLPSYTIEPPDILFIEAVRVVPKPPYHIQATDVLTIEIEGLFATEGPPRENRYLVDPAGRIDLGPLYGKVKVGGLTEDDAVEAIRDALKEVIKDPQVSVQLLQSTGLQPITGEHLVSPDGTVNLGTYGLVYVAGMTLEDAKAAIETQLEKFLDKPQVSVSVFAYNSKVYYVITEGAGSGDAVVRLPITGNETVLDAIAQINGLSRLSSKNIWIARPAPGGVGCDEILPVNWKEVTKGAATATNYQVLPGDRVFIAENKLIAIDAALNQFTAPFERIFGVTLLGTQLVQTINRFPLGFSGSGTF